MLPSRDDVSSPVRMGRTLSGEPTGSVLVVDDDAGIGLVLVGLHAQARIEARPVGSADGALTAFSSDSYDVVVTDLKMPGKDRMELLRELALDECKAILGG